MVCLFILFFSHKKNTTHKSSKFHANSYTRDNMDLTGFLSLIIIDMQTVLNTM